MDYPIPITRNLNDKILTVQYHSNETNHTYIYPVIQKSHVDRAKDRLIYNIPPSISDTYEMINNIKKNINTEIIGNSFTKIKFIEYKHRNMNVHHNKIPSVGVLLDDMYLLHISVTEFTNFIKEYGMNGDEIYGEFIFVYKEGGIIDLVSKTNPAYLKFIHTVKQKQRISVNLEIGREYSTKTENVIYMGEHFIEKKKYYVFYKKGYPNRFSYTDNLNTIKKETQRYSIDNNVSLYDRDLGHNYNTTFKFYKVKPGHFIKEGEKYISITSDNVNDLIKCGMDAYFTKLIYNCINYGIRFTEDEMIKLIRADYKWLIVFSEFKSKSDNITNKEIVDYFYRCYLNIQQDFVVSPEIDEMPF